MKAQILEAARAMMRQEGVAALSMQGLARSLDMRAPSLYNYFSSKLDIYDALFRLGFSLYAAHLEQALQGEHTWQEQLRLTLEAYMSFALENPELYQLCFERPVPGFKPSEESLHLSFGLLHRYYAEVEKSFPLAAAQLSAQQAVDLVIAWMHGLTALHLANQPDLPVGQGRFGALIPVAVAVLDKAWSPSV